ncbi:MAG: sulfite exporter TauE/SafE family protein [Chitinophagales bacterium]|nr:sulfite exporter TauE/SafE family protein [Chitinophagales bacterium]
MKQMSLTTVLLLMLIGVIAGMMSSLVGIGGGVIIVPALVLMFGLNQKTAQGTSLLLLSLPVAFAGAYNYYKAGHADWKIALILAVTFVIGGFFGSKIALGLEASVVKKIFAVFMIIIAVKYLFFDK